MRVKLAVPALGPGQLIILTDEPYQDPTGRTWSFEEMEAFVKALDKAPQEDIDAWLRFLDTVKRVYPHARLESIEPLAVRPLTTEQLMRVPWRLLPRP